MGVRPQVRLLSAAAVRLLASRLLLGELHPLWTESDISLKTNVFGHMNYSRLPSPHSNPIPLAFHLPPTGRSVPSERLQYGKARLSQQIVLRLHSVQRDHLLAVLRRTDSHQVPGGERTGKDAVPRHLQRHLRGAYADRCDIFPNLRY